MSATAPPARLKVRYLDEIRPALIERFGYSSVMQAPKLEKITLNMAVGQAKQDSKVLKAATEQLATIAGQQPSVRRARKSIAAFKLREGMPVGVAATLRADRGYEFLDRLVSIAIPRIRDFRGLNPRSFDGRGNYSIGVREQIIFPEIDYDAVDEVRGMDITITTSAASDIEAYALLAAFGLPFSPQGRPRGYDRAADEQAAQDAAEEKATREAAEADDNGAPAKAKAKQAKPEPADETSQAEPEPAAEESASEEEPIADEPTVEEPTAEEPTAGQSTAVEDAGEDAAQEPAAQAGEETAGDGDAEVEQEKTADEEESD